MRDKIKRSPLRRIESPIMMKTYDERMDNILDNRHTHHHMFDTRNTMGHMVYFVTSVMINTSNLQQGLS